MDGIWDYSFWQLSNTAIKAVEKYSEAIEADPNNAIYYGNRAAAYSQLNQHEQAVYDAKKALQVNPDYSKAYSRLGYLILALIHLVDMLNFVLEILKMLLMPIHLGWKRSLTMHPSSNPLQLQSKKYRNLVWLLLEVLRLVECLECLECLVFIIS